jgi:signal transduction histidine kinase
MSEKSSSVEEVFAAVAHQWRQPLTQINSIVSSLDNMLYEKGIEDSQIEKKLLEIERITRYMSESIDDFRNYFKKREGETKSRSLEAVIKELALLQSELLRGLDITLNLDLQEGLIYRGDITLLKQIIVTILNNAKDALVARAVFNAEISIKTQKEEEYLLIEVVDNAGGITKSALERLFDADFTTKHNSEGTGMGLYMVKKLLKERLNGEISVKNVHKGASFCIRVPYNEERE